MPEDRPYTPFTTARRSRFLTAIANGSSVAAACRRAGVVRAVPYAWRERDPDFARAWEEAYQAGTERLEDEARRRALLGVLRPVFYKGTKVGSVREYSDALLTLLLRARAPGTYNPTLNVNIAGYIRRRAIAEGLDPDAVLTEAAVLLTAARDSLGDED